MNKDKQKSDGKRKLIKKKGSKWVKMQKPLRWRLWLWLITIWCRASWAAGCRWLYRKEGWICIFAFEMSSCQQAASSLQACYVIADDNSVYRVYVYDYVSTYFFSFNLRYSFFPFLGFSPYVPAVSDPGWVQQTEQPPGVLGGWEPDLQHCT